MKTLFCSLLLSLSLLLPTQAQVPVSNDAEGLLWKIKGKGIKTSYLYGTLHLIPKDSFFLVSGLEKAMKKADRLVMEMRMEMNLFSMMSSMKDLMLPSDQPLSSLMSEEDYAYVQAYLQDSIPQRIGARTLERMQPFFLAEMVGAGKCNQSRNQASYEMFFNRRFKRMKKPVSGLETFKEQLRYLTSIPIDDQVDYLLKAIRNPYDRCEEYSKMVSLYRRQDLGTLMAYLETDEGLGGSLEQLLDRRNQNWIPKIQSMAQQDRLFIAVGAGHLGGEQGVIALLRKQGYQVSRIL